MSYKTNQKPKKYSLSQKLYYDMVALNNQPDRAKSAKKFQQKTQTVYIMIISDYQAAISMPYSLFSTDIKTFVKKHNGTWCTVFKVWRIPIQMFEAFRTTLPSILKNVVIEDPPTFVKMAVQPIPSNKLHIKHTNTFIKYSQQQLPKSETQNKLYQKLYPFQKESLKFCRQRCGRILIGDDMGIGKTIQSLACSLEYLQEDYPMLIICPSSLKLVWKGEIQKWLKNIIRKQQLLLIKKIDKSTDYNFCNIKIVIASYDIASNNVELFQKCNIVICDEAHYLKNGDTKRVQNLLPYLSSRKRIILLTGTPALAQPKQLFNLLSILRPDIYTNLQTFGSRYCETKRNPWTFKEEFYSSKNAAELHYLLKNVMIRRLKDEVLNDLPLKTRQIIMMETDKQIVKEIKSLLVKDETNIDLNALRNSDKLIEKLDQNNKIKISGSTLSDSSCNLTQCYLLSAMAKLQSVKKYLEQLLSNDIKILLFAHHQVIMDELEIFLNHIKCRSMRIDGSVSMEMRKKRIDMFQNDVEVRVALLSITAAGVGLTLTAASTVIFVELHWTPANLIQAEDRVHRIGQKNCVNIHYLIGEETLDGLLLRNLDRKLQIVSQVLDEKKEGMCMEKINTGQIGRFSVGVYTASHQKSTIPDYFKKTKTQIQKNEQLTQENSPSEQLSFAHPPKRQKPVQSLERQSSSLNQEIIRPIEGSDDDSLIVLLAKKRKKQRQNQPKTPTDSTL